MKNTINFIDLFCGVGGFSSGFKKEQFSCLFSIDNNDYCKKVYEENFPKDQFILKDINLLSDDEFLGFIGNKKVDLIIGGPPCQGFSTIGKRISSDKNVRKQEDERNNLVYEFIRLVKIAKPSYFIMENVRGIRTRDKGLIFKELLSKIESIDYYYEVKTLNSANYGVPQNRERVFIIGSRDDKKISFPSETNGPELLGLDPYLTVGDAINDLMQNKDIPNHSPLKHGEKNIRRYKLIPEGGRLPEDKLPEELYRKNFGNTFKRLDRSKPSLTIVPGHNAFPIHPVLDRSLTVREAARLQTFPDDFIFIGPRHEQCIQVGNAVPPHLSRLFAVEVKKWIENNAKI